MTMIIKECSSLAFVASLGLVLMRSQGKTNGFCGDAFYKVKRVLKGEKNPFLLVEHFWLLTAKQRLCLTVVNQLTVC